MRSKLGWLVLAWIALFASSRSGEALDVVKGGKPTAMIVLPDEPKAEEKAAAGELAAYVEKMTGARLEQKPLAQAGAGPRIHVGLTPFVAQQKLGLEKLDWDGFVLKLDELYERTILTNPLHKPVIPMTDRARNAPSPTLIQPLRAMAEWADGRGQWPTVKAQLERLARQRIGGDFAQQVQAVIYLREHPDAPELLKNPSVEATKAAGPPQEGIDWSSDGMPPDWAKWLRPGTAGKLTWTNEAARTGKMCLKAEGARAACFMQTVPAAPGETFVCNVHVKGKVAARNNTALVIQWLDPQGKWFQAPKKVSEMPTGEPQDWTPLTVFFKVPPGVGKAWVGVSIYDQEAGDVVYVDDWSVRKVEVGR